MLDLSGSLERLLLLEKHHRFAFPDLYFEEPLVSNCLQGVLFWVIESSRQKETAELSFIALGYDGVSWYIYFMDKTMNVYVITKGEYSDYRIVSVWYSQEKAEEVAEKLNGGIWYGDYTVESYPLNALVAGSDEAEKVAGFRASYDFDAHGWYVDESNIVFKEVLTSWDVEAFHSSATTVSVVAKTKVDCMNMLEVYALSELAKFEGNPS